MDLECTLRCWTYRAPEPRCAPNFQCTGDLHPRHIENPKGTPLANFFMTLAAKKGVRFESFGDSAGVMEV